MVKSTAEVQLTRYHQTARLLKDIRFFLHLSEWLVRRYVTLRQLLTFIAAVAGSASVGTLMLQKSPVLAGALGATGAIASLMNLVFKFDDLAQVYRELAQRYNALDQSAALLRLKIEREGYTEDIESALDSLQRDFNKVRSDEKPGRPWCMFIISKRAMLRTESEFSGPALLRMAPK